MTQADDLSGILEVLRKRGVLSGTSLRAVQGFMHRWDVDAYHAIVETHTLEESRISDLLAEELKIPRLTRLRSRSIAPEHLKFLDYALAMSGVMIVFGVSPAGSLQVAVADPTQEESLKKLRQRTGMQVDVFVADRGEIEATIQRNYPLAMQLPGLMSSAVRVGGGQQS